jgi:hypothetical protein
MLSARSQSGAKVMPKDHFTGVTNEARQARANKIRDGITRLETRIGLVAIRIVELARDGEGDPDKLTETVVAEFDR